MMVFPAVGSFFCSDPPVPTRDACYQACHLLGKAEGLFLRMRNGLGASQRFLTVINDAASPLGCRAHGCLHWTRVVSRQLHGVLEALVAERRLIYPFEESWFGCTPEEIESIVSSWLSHPGIRKSWRFNELVTAIARLECEMESLIRQSSQVPAKKSHDDECHSSHSQLRRRRPYTADIHAEAGVS